MITIPEYMKAKPPVKKQVNIIRKLIKSVLPAGSFDVDANDIMDTRKTQQNALAYGKRHGLKITTAKLPAGGLRVWVGRVES